MATKRSIQGSTFLFTGTLTEFTREEAEAMVKENGGSVLSGVTAKLNYLVVGENAGSKLAKAKALGTVIVLSEQEFLQMNPQSAKPHGSGQNEMNRDDKVVVVLNQKTGRKFEVALTDMQPTEMTWSKAKSTSEKIDGGWRLPSRDELECMYAQLHLKGLGNLRNAFYWSGSELDENDAWICTFGSDDGCTYDYKENEAFVRLVRDFNSKSTSASKPEVAKKVKKDALKKASEQNKKTNLSTKDMRAVRVFISGSGGELIIGTVDSEKASKISKKLNKVEINDILRDDIYMKKIGLPPYVQIDDQLHIHAAETSTCNIRVDDINGNMLFESEYGAFESNYDGEYNEEVFIDVADSNSYLRSGFPNDDVEIDGRLIYSYSAEKGCFFEGEIPLKRNEQFNPSLLFLVIKEVVINNSETTRFKKDFVTEVRYNDKVIENIGGGDTRGFSFESELVENE